MPVERITLVNTLRRVPLFNELSDEELLAIAERVVRRRLQTREILFTEGDQCRELFIVESGSVKILKAGSNGRQQLLSIERAGNTLAEAPVFDAGSYSTAAEAAVETTVLSLDANQFRQVCVQYPSVGMKVIRVLGHRLRHLEGLIESLSFSTVRGRLAAHLIQLAQEGGEQVGGSIEITLKENNEQLAVRLGTVRELISRNLGQLHGEGLIIMSRKKVVIPDPNALKRVTG